MHSYTCIKHNCFFFFFFFFFLYQNVWRFDFVCRDKEEVVFYQEALRKVCYVFNHHYVPALNVYISIPYALAFKTPIS